MSRESTLIILGVLVILSPFLGLPQSWLMWILPILGIGIIVLATALRARRSASREERPHLQAHEEEPA